MRTRLDQVGTALFVACLLFLTFLAGALVVVSKTPPAGFVSDAYRAAQALYARTFAYRDRYATDLWVEARSDRRGVTVHEPEAVSEGLTLYASGDAPRALLVNLDGQVVHEWQRPFSSVWDDSSPVRAPVPDDHVYFRKAHLYPDGDLLALYEGVGDTPYGYGLARLSVNSEVRWKNLDNFHHDFDVTKSGTIIGLTHAFRNTELPGADQFDMPILEDFLVVVGDDGRTRKKISLLDAVNNSTYRSYLWRIPYYSMEDPLHANSVDYLDRERAESLAARLPQAAEGQVLVSFRELAGGTIALVDIEREVVVWASHGPWLAQHDPEVLPGGTIQVFDNRGNLGAKHKSRILEVDPATMGMLWAYTGDSERPLDSPIRGSQQLLPNGNTLITESSGGRLLEVTREGRVVWEYINPVRGGKNENLIPVVNWAQRVPGPTLLSSFVARLAKGA